MLFLTEHQNFDSTKGARQNKKSIISQPNQYQLTKIYKTKLYTIDYTKTILDYIFKKLLRGRTLEIETSARLRNQLTTQLT